MTTLDLSRQADMVPEGETDFPILIIGAGGIGSNVAYQAVCCGFENITIFDPDRVGEENIAPQFFSKRQVGARKVIAVRNLIERMTGVRITACDEHFVHLVDDKYKVVIFAVDSIDMRAGIFSRIEQETHLWDFLIDGRMGGTTGSVICIPSEQTDDYMEFLEWEDTPLACGMKATAFMTKGILPGMIVARLVSIARGEKLPLLQTYDGVAHFMSEPRYAQFIMPDPPEAQHERHPTPA